MAKVVDVYRDWLGIQDAARPLNHYQLLRLTKFEDSGSTVRKHYQKMTSHVRRYAASDMTGRAQSLLNELTAAMLCLTDAQRKREYDAKLGRSDKEGGLKQRDFEDILLANKVVDQAQLAKARKYADAVNLEMRDAVLQQKLAPPDIVMRAYAESIGLPYVDLDNLGVSQDLVELIPANIGRQHSCVPIMVDPAQVLIASPNPLTPDVEEELRLRLSKQVRTVLCTPAAINTVVAQHYSAEAAAAAAPQKPGAPKPKPAPEPKTHGEKIKQRIMVSVVAFNVTVILIMILFFLIRGALYRIGWWPDMVVAVVLGAVAAIVTHSLAPKYIR